MATRRRPVPLRGEAPPRRQPFAYSNPFLEEYDVEANRSRDTLYATKNALRALSYAFDALSGVSPAPVSLGLPRKVLDALIAACRDVQVSPNGSVQWSPPEQVRGTTMLTIMGVRFWHDASLDALTNPQERSTR